MFKDIKHLKDDYVTLQNNLYSPLAPREIYNLLGEVPGDKDK